MATSPVRIKRYRVPIPKRQIRRTEPGLHHQPSILEERQWARSRLERNLDRAMVIARIRNQMTSREKPNPAHTWISFLIRLRISLPSSHRFYSASQPQTTNCVEIEPKMPKSTQVRPPLPAQLRRVRVHRAVLQAGSIRLIWSSLPFALKHPRVHRTLRPTSQTPLAGPLIGMSSPWNTEHHPYQLVTLHICPRISSRPVTMRLPASSRRQIRMRRQRLRDKSSGQARQPQITPYHIRHRCCAFMRVISPRSGSRPIYNGY